MPLGLARAVLATSRRAAAFTPHYADFDGTNDSAARGGALTGVVDGKLGILSCWLIFDALGASNRTVFVGVNNLVISWLASTAFRILGKQPSTADALELRINSVITTGTPYHILASWNLASAGTGRLYVNDVSDKNEVAYTNANIDYTETNYGCGAQAAGGNKFDGRMGEFYLNTAEYLDFDVASNRRKFRTAGGAPVDLGATGATPTGTQPAVYFSLRPGDAANDFINNRGSAGAFTLTGALTDAGVI